MTFTNTGFEQLASAMAGSTYTFISYAAFSSDVITLSADSTSLDGEFGSRVLLSRSHSTNTTTQNGIRSGASVASSSGEYLNALGFLSASSGGDLHAELLLSSILHTTDFDIEITNQLTFVGR